MPTEKASHTPGAIRAGLQISARFRKALPYLPDTNAETLAAIIDAETGAPDMLEALEAVKLELELQDYVGDALDKVNKAIRKAKGEL